MNNIKYNNYVKWRNKKRKKLTIIKVRPEPFISCFKLSFNLIANLIRVDKKIKKILSKTFYLMILQKKLAILYNKYLKNDFNDNMKEVKIKEIFEIKENLKDLKKSIFIPENFEQFLNFGRIIKIKYFGYGIIINKEKKSLNEKNDIIITENILNKIKKQMSDFLPKEEKNLFFESYEHNNYIYSDLYSDNNYQKKKK